MDLTGKVIMVLPKQTGEGKNGQPWQKQDYVMEYGDRYPKKLCFNLWGDKVDSINIQNGDEVTVSFDVESREYNGRWYTEVRAWNVSKKAAGQMNNAGSNSNLPIDVTGEPVDFSLSGGAQDEDLPF